MKRDELEQAIKSNRVQAVAKGAALLLQDPNLYLQDHHDDPEGGTYAWTVTPLFLAVDQACTTAEEREHNLGVINLLLTFPGIKASAHRVEDKFNCLAAAVYHGKSAVVGRLLNHLRHVEFKGNRKAFVNELNHQSTQLEGGLTALSWAILHNKADIARQLLAADPDHIVVSEVDMQRAAEQEEALDFLNLDLLRYKKEKVENKVERDRVLRECVEASTRYQRFDRWSEWATQALVIITSILALMGVFLPSLKVEPAHIVISSVVSLATWFFAREKSLWDGRRKQHTQVLIRDKKFFDDPSEIEEAVKEGGM
ncbi:MAG: hypothetical protein AAFQ98_03370 [Bacteroidota bacterium]